jgi:hypothetical protein
LNLEKAYLTAGPDGRLSIGNQVIELADESKKTFHTDNLKAFESFVAGRTGEAEIYYSATEVALVPTKAEKNFRPLAICKLAAAPALLLLKGSIGAELNINQFEKLLTSLRKYAVGSHLIVLSNLRSFSVAKKQTYERDIDNKGNFRLLVQRESAGAGDWTPPEKLTFALPVFTFLEESITIDCDLVFSVQDGGQPVFQLENLTFNEEALERRVEILDARLGKVATCPKYWGSWQHHELTDTWKWRENKAS